MIIGARMIFSRGEQIRASEGRKSPAGSKGGAPVGTGGDAPIIWQDVLKIMHKYIVYWDVGQHLLVPNAQKTLYSISKWEQVPPCPHCGRIDDAKAQWRATRKAKYAYLSWLSKYWHKKNNKHKVYTTQNVMNTRNRKTCLRNELLCETPLIQLNSWVVGQWSHMQSINQSINQSSFNKNSLIVCYGSTTQVMWVLHRPTGMTL